MKKIILLPAIIITMMLSTSCASTSANLQRETAISIGNITSDQVTVSDIQRGMTDVKWKAKTTGATYHCEADDMVRRVNCVKN